MRKRIDVRLGRWATVTGRVLGRVERTPTDREETMDLAYLTPLYERPGPWATA